MPGIEYRCTSCGLRASFPAYGYGDMVWAQYRLLTEGLGVNHLRLVMGTSMGVVLFTSSLARTQRIESAAISAEAV